MQSRIFLILMAVTLMLSISLVGCAPSMRTILSIAEGDVLLMKAGTGDWIEAEVGMSLGPGDSIKTGGNATVEITFSDGTNIELQPGIVMQIASLDIPTDTRATTIVAEQMIRAS